MRGVLLHQLRPPRQDEVAKISAVLAAADARSHRAADAHGRRTATEPEPPAWLGLGFGFGFGLGVGLG